jgi:hypothetical protein
MPVPVLLEVRERIPQPADGEDEVKVSAVTADPPWEPLKDEDLRSGETGLRGGLHWNISLQAGAKRMLKTSYTVQTSSKNEIIGGNRRET